MPALTLGGLFSKLRPRADATADAALLGRFVQTMDAEAFTEIVRRHGAMVLAVSRRVLGDGPDAEDAHQIAFMALARDAAKISDPNALAGWLYRAAWLTARKLAGRVHRRKPEPLTTDPTAPMSPAPENDVRAAIDEELLGLPERFRAVAVLCLVEGMTNTEAAGVLGIPKGTVDSRLCTAKQKLRERLLRRGIAAAALLSAEHLLTSETSAAATRAAALAANAVTVALDYAAGVPTAGTEHLLYTANGVRPVTNHLKWLAVALFTTAVVSGSGVGVYIASAQEKGKPPAESKKPDEKKPATETPKPDTPADAIAPAKTADDVQQQLAALVKDEVPGGSLETLLMILQDQTGVPVRIDTPSFVRRGWSRDVVQQLREAEVNIRSTKGMTTADLLREALGQAATAAGDNGTNRLSYRIKGNQILIIPEYLPPSVPGSGLNGDPVLNQSPNNLLEELYGEPVTVRYKKKSLSDVIEDLQDRTGANIVLNMRKLPEADPDKAMVTANFNDTRLLTVLKIVGDMHGLKPVVIDNVFYLTDRESADELRAEVNRDLFPAPPVAPVAPVPMK
jgi:RNA polymerase sigma factor (sigma-70 family)